MVVSIDAWDRYEKDKEGEHADRDSCPEGDWHKVLCPELALSAHQLLHRRFPILTAELCCEIVDDAFEICQYVFSLREI